MRDGLRGLFVHCVVQGVENPIREEGLLQYGLMRILR